MSSTTTVQADQLRAYRDGGDLILVVQYDATDGNWKIRLPTGEEDWVSTVYLDALTRPYWLSLNLRLWGKPRVREITNVMLSAEGRAYAMVTGYSSWVAATELCGHQFSPSHKWKRRTPR